MSVEFRARLAPNRGQQIGTVYLIGPSGVLVCDQPGLPHGIFGDPAGGADFVVPSVDLDFSEWEGAAVSLNLQTWGSTGTYFWPPCTLSGIFQPPDYSIVAFADGLEYASVRYSEAEGYVRTVGELFLLPAPFVIPTFEVQIGGSFHVLRASVVLLVARWAPDTPPVEVIEEPEPPFDAITPPLPNCGDAGGSPPVIGDIVSGTVPT